ncbi:MAG: hypothetical protein WC760_02905 [Bacteroidia bacterium]|jgi:hypothetical protein
MAKIKFIKDPTGVYRLGHFVGEVADYPQAQAEVMVSSGHAEYVNEESKAPVTETATESKEVEKAEVKPRKKR